MSPADDSIILPRSFFQRLIGRCATREPIDESCWTVSEGYVVVDLGRAEELASVGSAIRLEGKELKRRVLVLRGDDGDFYAFENYCTHGRRRLDPVPGAGTLQCCSLGKSTFDYSGKLLKGSAKRDLQTLSVALEGKALKIRLI
jgi:nitrite reductase/ring-hydroxylating ferredoxin subunit